jgi:hypothetical protein
MRSRSVVALTAISLTFSPAPALAAGFAGTFVADNVIFEAGSVRVGYASASNPDGCNTATSISITMSSTAEVDRAIAMILTSISTNKPITFWVDGCVLANGGLTIPKVVSVALIK